MLTLAQIRWASGHDWFVSTDTKPGCIIVRDLYCLNDVAHESLLLWNGSFQALRDWAGY